MKGCKYKSDCKDEGILDERFPDNISCPYRYFIDCEIYREKIIQEILDRRGWSRDKIIRKPEKQFK